jgi:HlyD family secretion protein
MLSRIAGVNVTLGCDGCGTPINATVDYVSNRAEFTPRSVFENRAKLVFLAEARPWAPTRPS